MLHEIYSEDSTVVRPLGKGDENWLVDIQSGNESLGKSAAPTSQVDSTVVCPIRKGEEDWLTH